LKIDDWTNKIHNGHVLDILKEIPNRSVDVVVTSPPYWGLRDYGSATSIIWDGDSNCKHEWGISQSPIHAGQVTQTKYRDRPSSSKAGRKTTGNFCSKCGAWNGQLGLEPHPQMYIDHLVQIFREVKRVLKDSGSFWLNLGDTYCGSGVSNKPKWKHKESIGTPNKTKLEYNGKWLQPKQKMLIPERVAIALQEDGWILRNDIIWYKPNHMPSSVKDRLTSSYEHVFFFVKNNKTLFWTNRFTGELVCEKPNQYYVHYISQEQRFTRPMKSCIADEDWFDKEDGNTILLFNYAWIGHPYYFDLDNIKVLCKPLNRWGGNTIKVPKDSKAKGKNEYAVQYRERKLQPTPFKNPADMWAINTKPFKGAHFAVFPEKLVERILKAACPRWICPKCGKPRVRILAKSGE